MVSRSLFEIECWIDSALDEEYNCIYDGIVIIDYLIADSIPL